MSALRRQGLGIIIFTSLITKVKGIGSGWLSQSPSIYHCVNRAVSSESALLLSIRRIQVNGNFLQS